MALVFGMISFVAGLLFWLRGHSIQRHGRDEGAALPPARVGRRAEPAVKQPRHEGSFWIFVGRVFMIGGAGFFGTMYVLTKLIDP
jgi:hypothetical protein